MLMLPQKHMDDKKADAIIAQYLNRNISGLVQDKISDYEKEWKKEAGEDVTIHSQFTLDKILWF